MPRWRWILGQLTRRLWLRATLIGLLGVAAAILAAVVQRFIPWDFPTDIGADAVDNILTIIASSMLAVTTFSLSVMTSAYGSATNNVTPRATKLLMEDRLTHTVLSTFIGSFLFSIVGIVVLKTGAYGDRGRFVLFVVTVVVIALIVVSLLRWIDHLTRLGRVGETTRQVEEATRQAIEGRLRAPCLGGAPLLDPVGEVPADAVAVPAGVIGCVQHVDLSILNEWAEDHDGQVYVAAIPGTFVYMDSVLVRASAPANDGQAQEQGEEDSAAEKQQRALRAAFTIGDERDFNQDPRFGLVVMSEIALRALSPGINDPGTAIDVIGRSARLLSRWAGTASAEAQQVRYPRVHVPPLQSADLFEDAFLLVARDGAGMIEVQARLQKSLLALGRMGDADFRAAAAHQAALALARAEAAMTLEADKTRLRALVAQR